uniref:Uncharacterized protein n=1 Tax=uncultured marine crenarchaeote SAT1000-21-C11 TaxID=526689 RepID=B3V6X6_9ARCH|nr:hypothetical protein [uncultured marine crenarchaeote SAT1000-21-C11]
MLNIFAFSSSVFCLFTKNFCILFVFTWIDNLYVIHSMILRMQAQQR